MSKTSHTYNSGFTLVELMISIAIIVLLTGIITANFTGSKAKARDGQRVSDIGQIQLAVSRFFDRCGVYPIAMTAPTGGTVTTSASDLKNAWCTDPQDSTGDTKIYFTNYIAKVPMPPSGTNPYDYVTNEASNSGVATDFVLHTKLEGPNNATKNSLDAGTVPDWFATYQSDPKYNCGVADESGVVLDYCVGSR